jgi:hypothetical protein
MFASPSVQRTTVEPGLPFEATYMAEISAGPNAVGPLASVLVKLLIKLSYD